MDKSTFAEGMRSLQEFHNKKLTPEQRDILWRKLSWIQAKDWEAGLDELTTKERFWPTPEAIIKHCTIAKERRVSREQSREREQVTQAAPSKRNNDLAKESAEAIATLLKMRPGPDKWKFEVTWARAMAEKYPQLAGEYRAHEAEALKKISNHSKSNQGVNHAQRNAG